MLDFGMRAGQEEAVNIRFLSMLGLQLNNDERMDEWY